MTTDARDSAAAVSRAWLRQRGVFVDVALLVLLIGTCYGLVWPVGEYPILDDWAFNKSLSYLNERGELRILDWNPMSLVGHLLWGWFFTKLFGASFTVTKLSVVALHFVECFALLQWLLWCGVSRRGAWLAVLALMFHPLHFFHCFTYDTDIPAITWQVLGLSCVARGLASDSPRGGWLMLGSAFAGWSAWTRQHGVVAWLAVATYFVVYERRMLRQRTGWCALVPGAALIAGFWTWYRFAHGPTAVFQVSLRQTCNFAMNPPWSSLPEIGLTYAVYLGSFVAALAVALPLSDWLRVGRRAMAVGMTTLWAMANGIGYLYLERNSLFPYLRNVVTPFGFFAPNTYLLGSREVLWRQTTAWVVTVLCVLGFIGLLHRFCALEWRQCNQSRRVTIRLCSLWLAWQLVYIAATTPVLFDRHLLILAPSSALLFVLLTPPETSWRFVPFAAVILPLGYYSLAGAHDVHAESRLAFVAARDLIASGVPAEKISGGYASDGWHLYEPDSRRISVKPLPPWWRSRLWDRLDAVATASNSMLDWPEYAWWFGVVRPPGEVDYVVCVSRPETVAEHESAKFHEFRRLSFVSGWTGRERFVFVRQRNTRDDSAAPNPSGSPP